MSNIIIVGGGISGLTTAYEINRNSDIEVTVLESEKRAGGQLLSERVEGFLCEAGAEGFVYNKSKPWTVELCEHLGISDKFIRPGQEIARRYYYIDGKLRLVPTSITSFLISDFFSIRGRLHLALEIFTKKAQEGIDETMAEFGKRHFGEEAVKKLIAPMAIGVYAGDPYKLSAKSAFPIMVEVEKKGDGSIIRAMLKAMRKNKSLTPAPVGVLNSFSEGIGFLIHALEKELEGSIVLGKKVTKIIKAKGRYKIQIEGNESMDTDAVVVSTPAYVAADILQELDPFMAEQLQAIPYPPMALVCLGYPEDEIPHPLDGFGFLVMPEERKSILGCTWDSSMFESRAPEGYVLMRVFVGGVKSPEIAGLKDEKLIDVVKRDLKDILNVDADPTFIRIYRYEKAIPQYNAGHANRVAIIEGKLRGHRGLFLTGNAYQGVGINDSVHAAVLTAQRVVNNEAGF
jgi:oxygen-dependent protoporphyrinogen oxidase